MFRAQGAGRRLRFIGSGSIVAGLVMLAIGVWCVTTLNGPSFDINTFSGAQPSVHDYVLLVIEIAVTLSGAFSLFFGIVTLRKGQKQLTFARSMHFVDAKFETAPAVAATGRCWQCGGKVRAQSQICYRCGAAQKHNPRSPKPGSSASQYGWDLAATSPTQPGAPGTPCAPGNISPEGWDAPASQWGTAAPTESWGAPMYLPGAPPPWVEPSGPPSPMPPGSAYPWQ